MKYELKENIIPSSEKLLNLYSDAGWSNYTKHMDMLIKSYENSLYILTAWDEDKLIGSIRVVGDGHSIIYIQDILVMGEYRHMGIGTRLLSEVMNKFRHVYQKVLLTDKDSKASEFYEKMGFSSSEKYGCVSYVIFNA